jgi:DNA polymerase-4
LAPLPVRKLPGVGEQTYRTLSELGIKTIRTLQEMPRELPERVLGKNGVSIWKKAQGIDNAPVIPYQERKSISMERTFDKDTADVKKLEAFIITMAEGLACQLRMGKKLTSCLTVKIRYSDFQTLTKQMRIPYTSLDHTLIQKAKDLFHALYQRRVLVRLIGVQCSHLVEGGYQMQLFEDSEEMINLYKAMDKLRAKYKDSRLIKRAIGMDLRTMNVGNPFNGQPPVPPAHRHC